MEMLMVPAVYDVLWSLVVLMVLPLTVVALMKWRTDGRAASSAAGWLLAILLLPGLGALVYLAVASRAAAGRPR